MQGHVSTELLKHFGCILLHKHESQNQRKYNLAGCMGIVKTQMALNHKILASKTIEPKWFLWFLMRNMVHTHIFELESCFAFLM
jgi:hypothetical protein